MALGSLDGGTDMESKEFTVVATSLKLASLWKLPRFLRFTNRIGGQLRTTPGMVSHRLKADFLRLRFSTISIWDSDASIDEFVKQGAHQVAMQAVADVANPEASKFVRWKTADREEVTWSEAFRRLAIQDGIWNIRVAKG